MTMRCKLLCAAVLIVTVGGMVRAARGHDGYDLWRVPDNPGMSCCDDKDCKPTRAYLHEDGLWRAWDGHAWLSVPPSKMLPVDYKGDGRSHLCSRMGYVLCFSPTSAKG
jgi:hypothetical protein